jgi:hypothetical protein
LAAGAGKDVFLRDPLHAETVASIAAIDGAKRLGTKKIVFESDSSLLVQALQTNDYDRSTIGDLVKTAKRKCVTSFDSFQFSFCRRECNSAAHELAKFSVRSLLSVCYWEDSAPNCVKDILASDLAVQAE